MSDPNGEQQFMSSVFPEEYSEIWNRRLEVFGLPVPGEKIKGTWEAEKKFLTSEAEKEEFYTLSAIKSLLSKARKISKAEEQTSNLRKNFVEAKRQISEEVPGPSTKYGLIGLALSGGGIRSATFNLGVLQALAHRGVLQLVDYLSTVSGGGYIGGSLSSLLTSNHFNVTDRFPFNDGNATSDSSATVHLRNSGNYLAPNGFFDYLRIPVVLFRGIIFDLLLVLPYLAIAAICTKFALDYWIDSVALSPKSLFAPAVYLLIFWLMLVLFYPTLAQTRLASWRFRNNVNFFYTLTFFFVGLVGLVCAILPVADWYDREFDVWLKTSVANADLAKITMLLISLMPLSVAKAAVGKADKLSGRVISWILALLGPIILFGIYLEITHRVLPLSDEDMWNVYKYLLILFLFTIFVTNVNKTSMHEFYRDRLSKAYMIQKPSESDDWHTNNSDKQTLSKLSHRGPYHLIQTALNLTGSKDENLRGRNADYFVVSKRYCGSDRTGYIETKELEELDPHINLGSAVAISGAAAAANMGTSTVKSLVFLLTLLNIRLGYWVPNPRYYQDRPFEGKMRYRIIRALFKFWSVISSAFKRKGTSYAGVPTWYFFYELLGRIKDDSNFVNVSDGGYIENMGLYPLRKRRCRFIIVSDAEQDGKFCFDGLASALRYAKIDMGILVNWEEGFTLDSIRPQSPQENANGKVFWSPRSFAIGKIWYPDGESGTLIYLKSSLSADIGKTATYIRAYKERNETFPHETTTDQFFTEAQFEAYRELGYRIVNEMLPREVIGDIEGRCLAQWQPDAIMESVVTRIKENMETRIQKNEK